jgi:hypothetical protein
MKYYRSDPLKRGRGSGYYYRRGGYKKGWMSKYSGRQDGNYRPSLTTKKLKRNYEHTGDRNRRRMTRHKVNKSPKKFNFIKGWF